MAINYAYPDGFTFTAGTLGAIASIETSPGVYKLIMGSSVTGKKILVRDSSYTIFTDNGSPYEAGFIIGSVVLASPGELAELAFITSDFIRTGSSPSLGVLCNEIQGNFSNISGYVVQDPTQIYGAVGAPVSLFSNRYYLRQTVDGAPPGPAWMRHLQIIVDFGNTDTVQNEILTMTLFGAILMEGS